MACRCSTRARVERGRGGAFYAVAFYGRGGELLDATVFKSGRSPLIDELIAAPLAAWPAIASRYSARPRSSSRRIPAAVERVLAAASGG
jgi:hypothetical protein